MRLAVLLSFFLRSQIWLKTLLSKAKGPEQLYHTCMVINLQARHVYPIFTSHTLLPQCPRFKDSHLWFLRIMAFASEVLILN
ncbi:MAG: hypothetical protein NXY57DRAFT_1009256 [Lentinula lateritia]|uniref:Secreted protein n=1 Tax=Lentinula lateritia TaxID=40482 RepID=A0ABQ8VKJ7_9AGAR|nr:MAG: hypothetical protein NXY57DRAFT_1009256 [Lentinula lateritia]KAJ4496926.1 hypothetical protein C8R41DRAFT_824002 [Lentinula lateritia]